MLSARFSNGKEFILYVGQKLEIDVPLGGSGYAVVDGQELEKVRAMYPAMIPSQPRRVVYLVNDDLRKVMLNWN